MNFQANRRPKAAPSTTSRRVFAGALLAAAAGLLAPACADNESTLFIRDCIPATFQQQLGCVTPEPSDATNPILAGRLDLAFRNSYSCALRVGNQLVEQGSDTQIRTETSRVTLYAADVRITDLAGEPISYAGGGAVEFSVPVSGFVDPGTGEDAGYGYANVLMIDTATAEAIGQTVAGASGQPVDVLAGIIVYGRTLGGQELETPEWFFPINVCIGCACSETESCEPMMAGGGQQLIACTTDFDFVCSVDDGIPSPVVDRECVPRTTAALAYYGGL